MDFPVLPQDIQDINEKLKRHFGVDTESGQPIWRVSWSNDQYEKRLTEYTDEGLKLLFPEVRELPKYQWCRDRWIIERLVLIPDVHLGELPTQKKSYECMQYFEHFKTGDAIIPSFEACKFIVDTVYAAMSKRGMRHYVEDLAKETPEKREERINKIQDELFGDESSLLGRTITGEAVAYTGEPKIEPASQKE